MSDNQEQRVSLQSMLTEMKGPICDAEGNIFGKKVSIVTADSAQEAFDILQRNLAVNIIFSDAQTDGKYTGIDLLRAVRDYVTSALIGIENNAKDAKDMGVTFLNKPVLPDSLRNFIKKAIRKTK